MKTQHGGDCSIYACLINNTPEAGICTCGYGHQLMRTGDYSEMYSKELEQKLEKSSTKIRLDSKKGRRKLIDLLRPCFKKSLFGRLP